MSNNIKIDWKLIENLFICLKNYGFEKISNDFNINNELYNLDQFQINNKVKLLIKKLNCNNIYIDKINCNFSNDFNMYKYTKKILCEKNNGILKIYIWEPKKSKEVYNNTLYGIISLLKYIDKKYNFNNFPITIIDLKFKLNPIDCTIIHPINNQIYKNSRMISCCFNKEFDIIPLFTYYIWCANKCFRNNPNFKFQKPDYIINYLNNNIKDKPFINKLVFRGREKNDFRRKLYSLYENNDILFDIKDATKANNEHFLDFIEQTNYKYMLDMHGLTGHSGRRYWMFHFNRVLFLPIDDPNKLFWEISDNPPIPWVHFVPYSLHNLQELEYLVKKLENDDNLYNKIKNECKIYANTYLSFDAICKYAVNIF